MVAIAPPRPEIPASLTSSLFVVYSPRPEYASVNGKRVQLPHGPAAVTGDNIRRYVTVALRGGKTRVIG